MLDKVVFILLIILVACVVMMAPVPAEAGGCGGNNFGSQGLHPNSFNSFGGYNTNFGANGFFVAAPQPPAVFFVSQGNNHRQNPQPQNFRGQNFRGQSFHRQDFNPNDFRGREFRQETVRGPFGGIRRQTTTIR